MDFSYLNLLLIFLIALSACGSEPAPVNMDRRYLDGKYLVAEKARLQEEIQGEVLDAYEWILGDQKVYTILSKESVPGTDYSGIFLRQYDVSGQQAALMWTYQDSVSCRGVSGAAAGAVLVDNHSPSLRPSRFANGDAQQFVLRYNLGCSPTQKGKNLVVVNAISGTPDVRLWGTEHRLEEATGLRELPENTIREIFAVWESV